MSEVAEEEERTTMSLSERYQKAVDQVESSPEKAVDVLTKLQHEVASTTQALFSFGSSSTGAADESMDDIATSSLPLLMLEHHLALAYTKVSTNGMEGIDRRLHHLNLACDLWASFLQKLEALEQLNKQEEAQYRDLLELVDTINNNINDNSDDRDNTISRMPPPVNRDTKIARYNAKQKAENERQRLQSLRERRGRLGIAPEDEMDGLDQEALARTLALTNLDIAKNEALEEWSSTIREIPMISIMLKSQQERNGQERRYQKGGASATDNNNNNNNNNGRQQPGQGRGLQVTHITQDGASGQLHFRREQVRANVLRPGWNQPTMSLQELGERERREAVAREARQKESEALAKTQPRRYDQLQKDGLEDNADLVDASAVLDRKWDAFKDENPRGSGNKRGDVGDRNF